MENRKRCCHANPVADAAGGNHRNIAAPAYRLQQHQQANQAPPSLLETFTRKFSVNSKQPVLIQMERQQSKSMRTTDQLRSMDGDQSIDSLDSPMQPLHPEEDNRILVSHPRHQPNTDRLA